MKKEFRSCQEEREWSSELCDTEISRMTNLLSDEFPVWNLWLLRELVLYKAHTCLPETEKDIYT